MQLRDRSRKSQTMAMNLMKRTLNPMESLTIQVPFIQAKATLIHSRSTLRLVRLSRIFSTKVLYDHSLEEKANLSELAQEAQPHYRLLEDEPTPKVIQSSSGLLTPSLSFVSGPESESGFQIYSSAETSAQAQLLSYTSEAVPSTPMTPLPLTSDMPNISSKPSPHFPSFPDTPPQLQSHPRDHSYVPLNSTREDEVLSTASRYAQNAPSPRLFASPRTISESSLGLAKSSHSQSFAPGIKSLIFNFASTLLYLRSPKRPSQELERRVPAPLRR